MENYDEVFQRIRQTIRQREVSIHEYDSEIRKASEELIRRFVNAGWSPACGVTCARSVDVFDPDSSRHCWFLSRGDHLEDCLKALVTGERARARDEAVSDNDRTFLRIRQAILQREEAIRKHNDEIHKEATTLTGRFIAVGYTRVSSHGEDRLVEVLSPNGDWCHWYLGSVDQLESCLNELAAAEKAAGGG